MTRDRDIELVLEHWLTDGADEMPDRVYQAIFDRVERQPQAVRPRLLRRITTVNIPMRLLVAAAAVIAVSVVAVGLLRNQSSAIGGPAPSPTMTPSPTPSPSARAYIWPGALEPGTYTTRFIWDTPFAVTLTVPDGWQSRDVEVIRDPKLGVSFFLVGNVYQDPCQQVLRDPPIGPSVDELAAALSTLPGVDATAPAPVTLGGYSGRYVEFVVPRDAACPPGSFYLWHDPADSYLPVGPKGPPDWTAEQSNNGVWILDVEGLRYVVSALWSDDATPADLAELQAVIDSIHIDPVRAPSTTEAPQPAAS